MYTTITFILLCFVASSLCFDFNGVWYRESAQRQTKVTVSGSFVEGVIITGPYAVNTAFNVTLVGDKTFGFGSGQLFNTRTNLPTNLVDVLVLGDAVSKNVFRVFYGASSDYVGGVTVYTRYPEN
eukprot:TRINITY_DN1345_c0_g1_i1.p1 TRINITY_DN1345_c0_g1~~TRINITY_DN1345_c0_g1_i1.p1  ORF type:complete len:125 (-),score=16.49 TRINITY_DN1345_c0_g1_i1:323-697(-)